MNKRQLQITNMLPLHRYYGERQGKLTIRSEDITHHGGYQKGSSNGSIFVSVFDDFKQNTLLLKGFYVRERWEIELMLSSSIQYSRFIIPP
jgi:hypothetical protein